MGGQETQTVAEAGFELDGKQIHLIDTPGSDGMNRSVLTVLVEVISWLKVEYSAATRLNGVVYLRHISDPHTRFTTESIHFRFASVLGNEELSTRIALVTSIWDSVDQRTGQARELKRSSRFGKPLPETGSSMYRYDGTRRSALRIVHSLSSGKLLEPLQIQRELVDEIPLLETIIILPNNVIC